MGRYVIRRVLQAIPVLFGATLLIFLIVFALPGDPIAALAGDKRLDPNIAAVLREQYHLNDPVIVQYGYYIGGPSRPDLGRTFGNVPVSQILAGKFQVSFNLTMTALMMEAIVGVLLGLYAALRRGKAADSMILATTLVLIAVPTLVTGFVLQWVLGVQLKQKTGIGFFPVAGTFTGWPHSYLLPGFVLAGLSIAFLTRLTRTSLVETLRADYVRTAVAKGLKRRRVIGRHALRNALIPLVTYLGTDLGTLMGGAVITETIFNLPGVGQQLYQSIYLREQPVVVGTVTVLVLIYIVANLIVDLLYAVLDPRIRYE